MGEKTHRYVVQNMISSCLLSFFLLKGFNIEKFYLIQVLGRDKKNMMSVDTGHTSVWSEEKYTIFL